MKYACFLALLAAFALPACASDDGSTLFDGSGAPPSGACRAGEIVVCACPASTVSGQQVCQTDGSFGVCLGCPGGGAGGQAGSPGGGAGGNAGSGMAGSGNAGSGQAGSGQAGNGQAGSGDAGSGQAGNGQAGNGQAGGGNGGSGQAGGGMAGAGQAGSGPGCGDGVRQAPAEQCDGQDFGELTCVSLFGDGYSGALACSAACVLDTSKCEKSAQPPVCGDGAVNQASEQCDGSDFAGTSCAKALGLPGATGMLGCDANCQLITTACQNTPTCGNDQLDAGEQCDGSNLGGQTCATAPGSLGPQGSLGCSAGCAFDTSQCAAAGPVCGDGKRNGPQEKCDGADLDGATCESALGTTKATGTLGCTPDCSLDTSQCVVPPFCGDGKKNGTDECDGTDFGAETCASKLGPGYAGELVCSGNCQTSTSHCMLPPPCGNGQIDAGEQCDGAALGPDAACNKLVGPASTGPVSCGPTCAYDTSKCTTPPPCGNGKLDPGEDCDDGNAIDDKNGCSAACKVYCVGAEQKFGTHCYVESTDPLSWDKAQATCAQAAGHLVTITSQEEFDFVYNNVFDSSLFGDTSPRWIGLNDKTIEGTFQWVDGEPVAVTAWASGQPDNAGTASNADCVDMSYANGNWSDQVCTTTHLYVCEYDPIVKFP